MANNTLSGTTTAVVPTPRRDGDDRRPGPHVDLYHQDLRRQVQRTLANFLAGEVSSLDAVDPALGAFARTSRDYVLTGGKRLRSTFAYWGWRGLVGIHKPVAPVLPALAALELLHTFALAHDDVMDASATRRGRPTLHRVFAAEHVADDRRGDADHFGEAAAVLVGDLCVVWADRLMAAAAVPSGRLLAARRCYDQMRVEAVAGQYLDVLGEAASDNWSLTRAMRVARHKTASYTVLRPLQFGAALAGTSGIDAAVSVNTGTGTDAGTAADTAAILSAYRRYGLAVGEAFQLRDDLISVYGDPAVTGKPAGDDLRAGKPTALLMMARQLATPGSAPSWRRRGGRPVPAGVVTAAGTVVAGRVVMAAGTVVACPATRLTTWLGLRR